MTLQEEMSMRQLTALNLTSENKLNHTLTFLPNPGNKLTVSANNTISCSQNRFVL
jgi:hypothetical protein